MVVEQVARTPHRRAPEREKQRIDVRYGEATGALDVHARMLRSAQVLELVAGHAADHYAWRAPFTIELQSCGAPNAHWDVATHKLTMCYELAEEYVGLYGDYALAAGGRDHVAGVEQSRDRDGGMTWSRSRPMAIMAKIEDTDARRSASRSHTPVSAFSRMLLRAGRRTGQSADR